MKRKPTSPADIEHPAYQRIKIRVFDEKLAKMGHAESRRNESHASHALKFDITTLIIISNEKIIRDVFSDLQRQTAGKIRRDLIAV